MQQQDPHDLSVVAERVMEAASAEEDFDWRDWFAEVDPDDKVQIALLWLQLKRLASAVNGLVRSVDEDLGPLLKERGAVSFGDTLIYATQRKREKVIDTAGFEGWMKQNPELVSVLFNPNDVRLGKLPQAVRDTFFEVEILDGVKTTSAPKEFIR